MMRGLRRNQLPHIATCCNRNVASVETRHNATPCNTLQRTATHAIHIHTISFICLRCSFAESGILRESGSNTLQHTATHCNTLQHTATHCNTCYTKTYIFIYHSVGAAHLRKFEFWESRARDRREAKARHVHVRELPFESVCCACECLCECV